MRLFRRRPRSTSRARAARSSSRSRRPIRVPSPSLPTSIRAELPVRDTRTLMERVVRRRPRRTRRATRTPVGKAPDRRARASEPSRCRRSGRRGAARSRRAQPEALPGGRPTSTTSHRRTRVRSKLALRDADREVRVQHRLASRVRHAVSASAAALALSPACSSSMTAVRSSSHCAAFSAFVANSLTTAINTGDAPGSALTYASAWSAFARASRNLSAVVAMTRAYVSPRVCATPRPGQAQMAAQSGEWRVAPAIVMRTVCPFVNRVARCSAVIPKSVAVMPVESMKIVRATLSGVR